MKTLRTATAEDSDRAVESRREGLVCAGQRGEEGAPLLFSKRVVKALRMRIDLGENLVEITDTKDMAELIETIVDEARSTLARLAP